MTTANSTHQYAAFFSSLSLAAIPQDVQRLGKLLILDTLGCMAAGARTAHADKIKQIAMLFAGPGEVSQAGLDQLQGAVRAAYVNARLANLLDFDETYPVGVHFGIAAVIAAVAGVQVRQENMGQVLCAAIAGYEAGARMASAVGPMMTVTDGAVTGFSRVWGVAAPVVIAACVAYGHALKITPQVLHQALGIAGSNIPLPIGSKWSEATHLPDVKYCDAGWCTVTAIHGVHSALAGLTGFEDILEGESGIPEAYSAVMADPAQLHRGLGQRWHLPDLTFKPWPSCRFMHAPMSALKRLLTRHGVKPSEIDEIVVYTGPLANSARFRNSAPRTFSGYQFSYAHACAMLAMNVPAGADWFDEAIAESDIALGLRSKVRIEYLDAASGFARHMVDNQIRVMPGAARVRTARGDWYLQCDYADGDPWDSEARFNDDDVINKFLVGNPGEKARGFSQWFEASDAHSALDPLTTFIREL